MTTVLRKLPPMQIDLNTDHTLAMFGIGPKKSTIQEPKVTDVIAQHLSSDIQYLATVMNPGESEQTPDAAAKRHIESLVNRYVQNHPLGFLAKDSKALALSFTTEAVRRDALQMLQTFNAATSRSAATDIVSTKIAELGHAPTKDLFSAMPSLFQDMYRNMIAQAAQQMRMIATIARDDIWFSPESTDRLIAQRCDEAAQTLDQALTLLNAGDIDDALNHYNTALRGATSAVSRFQDYYAISAKAKFGATIAVTGVAAYAAAMSGAWALAILGGGARIATTGLASKAIGSGSMAALAYSSIISGTTFITVDRALNTQVFNKNFLSRGTSTDKALDFAGDALGASALFGFMQIWSKGVSALPKATGELAGALNAGTNFAYEFTGLTGYSAATAEITHQIDAERPGAAQVLSPDNLAQSVVFLFGLKAGRATAIKTVQTVVDLSNTVASNVSASLRAIWQGRTLDPVKLAAMSPEERVLARLFANAEAGAIRLPSIENGIKWLDDNLKTTPIILIGAFNINASYFMSLGLRYVASRYFPGLADDFPSLFSGIANMSFFNVHDILVTWGRTNAFGLGILIPLFAGYPGCFSPKIAQVKLDPKVVGSTDLTRGQVAKMYGREFLLRGLQGVNKVAGIRLSSPELVAAEKTGVIAKVVGFSSDLVANTFGDVTYAAMFKSNKTLPELFWPGFIISGLVGYANTLLTQHVGFTHGQQFLRRTGIGIGKSGVYRGFCATDALTWPFNMALQIGYGALAIAYARAATSTPGTTPPAGAVPATGAMTPMGPQAKTGATLGIGLTSMVSSVLAAVGNPFARKPDRTIVVTDSGLGGMSVVTDIANRLLKASPFARVKLVFFNAQPNFDDGFTGYGRMPTMDMKAAVFNRALHVMQKRYKPDMVVLACNTLSAVFPHTDYARTTQTPATTMFKVGADIMFDALRSTPGSRVLIMATPTTIESGVYQRTLANYGIQPDRVLAQPCLNLAAAIELDKPRAQALIDQYVDEGVAQLGHDRSGRLFVGYYCTHYGFVDAQIRTAFARHGLTPTVLNPNAHMMDDYLGIVPATARPAQLSIEVISEPPLEGQIKSGFGALIDAASPEVGKALREYKHVPNLFQWEDIVPWGYAPRETTQQ